MARANFRTFGLLNRWAEIMHEDPFRFNQIAGEGVRVAPNSPNNVYIQYDRNYIANALYNAVLQTRDALGFYPAPAWIEDEILTVDPDLSWNRQTFVARYGHIQTFGRRATSVIAEDVTVNYSDENGDQVDETATITITDASLTDMDVDEIEVFFRTTDGAPSGGHEYWQIEPLTITKSGSTVTITGHRSLFVDPKAVWAREYAAPDWTTRYAGDTSNADSFVSQVDVYRVYADSISAVQLLLNAGVVGAANAVVNATASLSDAYQGEFYAYTADAQSAPGATPDKVRISYKAGHPLLNGKMEPRLETGIIRFANTLMPQGPSFGDRTQVVWNEDRKVSELLTKGDASKASPPFGISNAGLFLWSVVGAMRNTLKATVGV